jgi:hypothetical protein
MADRIPAGVDPGGLRNIIGDQINPATEETLQSLVDLTAQTGIIIPESDSVYATYPTSETEVYTYKLNGSTVATLLVTYSDSTKEIFISAEKT